MEADIVVAKEPVNDAGEDVLAAVLLHHRAPARHIDAPLDLAAHLERRVRRMHDLALHLMRVEHMRSAQRAMVGALTAALREEGRSVEHDGIALSPALAGAHRRRKYHQLRILIIQANCHPYRLLRVVCSRL